MSRSFKITFDYIDDYFLKELERTYVFYNDYIELEYKKQNKWEIIKEIKSFDELMTKIRDKNIQSGHVIFYSIIRNPSVRMG